MRIFGDRYLKFAMFPLNLILTLKLCSAMSYDFPIQAGIIGHKFAAEMHISIIVALIIHTVNISIYTAKKLLLKQ